ncbi:PREDICTED: neprilysin-11-like [Priapulus caudatus]|uniref:Neprilysin-11-like n=1 Tax=Priapulus caudatus TaxID=37621 RepID=A0ABM1E1D6_PRICU|nr:PREDICTED: neprilysin-11-like [Priapulus caudatus]
MADVNEMSTRETYSKATFGAPSLSASSRTNILMPDPGNAIKFSGSRWSRAHRILLALVILLLLISIALAATLAVFYLRLTKVADDSSNVCVTPACVQYAAMFSENMNRAADPCEDFYEYACGGWIRKNEISADELSHGVYDTIDRAVLLTLRDALEEPVIVEYSEATRKTRKLYEECIDIASVDERKAMPLRQLLRDLNATSWPITEAQWDPVRFDLTRLLAVAWLHGFDAIYDLSVGVDDRHSDRHILTLDSASLGLGENTKNQYLNRTEYGHYINAYRRYMNDIAKILNPGASDYSLDTRKLLDFETELAMVHADPYERQNSVKLNNVTNLRNLSATYTAVDWTRLISMIRPHAIEIGPNDSIVVVQPAYMRDVDDLLRYGIYEERLK